MFTIVIGVVVALCVVGMFMYWRKRGNPTNTLTGGVVTKNDPHKTLKFTPDDVIKDNIPIASVSKLVLACIYHMHSIEHTDLLSKMIVPFTDYPNLVFNVDELLHMKGGLPFTCGGNTEADVLKSISILKDYTNIRKPTTYSNVTFMLLSFALKDLVGVDYIKSLAMLSKKLKIDNTWSCPLWKPGSGDIVSIKADMIKIGNYVQDNYEWFACVQSVTNDDTTDANGYRGRGIDVISSNTTLLNDPDIKGEFIIKDGSQGVPMVSQIDFSIDNVPAKYNSHGEIKHTCRLLIPRRGDVKFINSLTDIHPFTYPLSPYYRIERPTFDSTTHFCVDLFGSSIEPNEEVEVIHPRSYAVFQYSTFDTLPLPSWANVIDITTVTFCGRGTFTMPATVEILHERFLQFNFEMNYFGKVKHFHPIFVVDNIKNDVVYLISPFDEAERPYAKLEREGLKLTWYTP